MYDADIDIDLPHRERLLDKIKHTPAMIDRGDNQVKHPTGVYFQPIPKNPLVNHANIDHREAGKLGYFKFDLLNNSIYEHVENEDHLIELLNQEPDWSMLEDTHEVENLYHLSNYASLTAEMKPQSIDQLAMLLAIIRPAKAHLRNRSWSEIEREVWVPPTDGGYFFKKSHSYAFAAAIIVQMNSIRELRSTNRNPFSL